MNAKLPTDPPGDVKPCNLDTPATVDIRCPKCGRPHFGGCSLSCPPTDEKPSRAQAMYERWTARKLAEAPKDAGTLYQWQGFVDDWYQHHDGIAVTLMRRDLADHALEEMESLVKTVGEMLAEGKRRKIGALARRVAEEFMERHVETLRGLKK